MSDKNSSEKRQADRVESSGPVTIKDPRTQKIITHDAKLKNINRWGFAMTTSEPLTRGLDYEFTVHLTGAPTYVKGRVVFFQNEWQHFRVGVSIKSIPFGQRRRFNRFLAQKNPIIHGKYILYCLVTGGVVWLVLKFLLGLPLAVGLICFGLIAGLLYATLPF